MIEQNPNSISINNIAKSSINSPTSSLDTANISDILKNMVQDYTYRMSELERDVAEIKSNYAKKENISSLEIKLTDKITSNFRWLLGIILTVAGGGVYYIEDSSKVTANQFQQVDSRFQQTEDKIHSLDIRLTKVELKVDQIDKKIDDIDDKLDLLIQQKTAQNN